MTWMTCAASVMKNILQGNSEILIHADRTGTGKIPMIRPFITIPKKEVALYATLHARGYDQSRCPYNNKPFEKDVREMLDEFTTRHPATKYALMNLKKNLTSTCYRTLIWFLPVSDAVNHQTGYA